MEDIKLTYREVLFAFLIFNVLMGVLFGSLPLIAGLMLKKQRRAWIGFAVAVVVGTMLGALAAYIVAVIFLWLILRQQPAASDAVEVDAEIPDA